MSETAATVPESRFLAYIDLSREYYAAQGYTAPYKWAAHDDAPFQRLRVPTAEARVGLVTTTLRHDDDPLAPYAESAHPPPTAMATDHLHWHHGATHTRDPGSYLPLAHLRSLAEEGRVGSTSPRFYGIPTIYSQRRTRTWSDRLAEWMSEDAIDLAILAPL